MTTAAFQRQAVDLGDGAHKELFGGVNRLDFHIFDFIVIIKLGERKISYSINDSLEYQCWRLIDILTCLSLKMTHFGNHFCYCAVTGVNAAAARVQE